jgi:transposase
MIVIGLDVHKQSVTAVVVDEAGRPLNEKTIQVGSEELLGWACALDGERLWAVEDCRQLTGWLERQLLAAGEGLVRVPPKLTVPERRAGRAQGAGAEPATAGRAGLSGDQAAGRPSRRSC